MDLQHHEVTPVSVCFCPKPTAFAAGQALAGGMRCAVLLSRGGRLETHELTALAANGASVFIVKADAGDATAIARVLAWARERLPAVSTYAHAAGALAKVGLPGISRRAGTLFALNGLGMKVPTPSEWSTEGIVALFALDVMPILPAVAPHPDACAYSHCCCRMPWPI